MMRRWLSAAILAVAFAVSACGGTIEAPEDELAVTPESSVAQPEEVDSMAPLCDAQGRCPVGYYCIGGPGGACRRGPIEPLLPMCDEEGRCPEGFYCVGGPFGVCRRGIIVDH